MKLYTKTGDNGSTSLMQMKNVAKSDDRIHLLGNLDELTSNIGLIKALETNVSTKLELERIQKNLMRIMASIADQYNKAHHMPEEEVAHLEQEIDRIETSFPRVKEFVLPGNCEQSARLDIARTITRRTERYLIAVDHKYRVEPGAKKYINRLSDYFYMLARYADYLVLNQPQPNPNRLEHSFTQDDIMKAVIAEVMKYHDTNS